PRHRAGDRRRPVGQSLLPARSHRHREGPRADAGQGDRRRGHRRRQDRSGSRLDVQFLVRQIGGMAPRRPDPLPLADAVAGGDRTALARAITLIESTRADHRDEAEKMLARLLPRAGGAIRLGVSGAPGVGKSTFIEAFGLMLIEEGHRVAVLAVDPSSKRAGGSILGDKTRMARLSQSDAAFIRPSPAGKSLGGVDDLQGIKKGIVELADLVIVNKDDGDLAPAAKRAVADYRHALRLLAPAGGADAVETLAVSALERRGLDKVWSIARRRLDAARASGAF